MNPHMREVAGAGIAGIALVVSAGCAQPPADQLAAAHGVIIAAKEAGATEYAKEEFAQLEQQFTLAMEELAKQEKSLSIFRSYTEADKMLSQAVKTGRQVTAMTTQRKEAAKTAAMAMEKEAQQAVNSAKELLTKVPAAKDQVAVEAIEADLDALDTNLSAVHELIEKGDYQGAELQGKSLKERGSTVSQEIQHAIDKAEGKKAKAHA